VIPVFFKEKEELGSLLSGALMSGSHYTLSIDGVSKDLMSDREIKVSMNNCSH